MSNIFTIKIKYIISFFNSKNEKVDEIEIIDSKKEVEKIAKELLKANNYTTYKIKKEETIIVK